MAENTATKLSESPNLTLESLTDELLAHCFSFLDAKDLSTAELGCLRFKHCIADSQLWAAKCSNLFPALAHLLDGMDTSDLEATWPCYRGKRAMQLSAACKRLFSSLAASSEPERHSLLSTAVGVSSQDNEREELNKTLSPRVRGRNNFFCYWSSTGSEDENSNEWVAYRLCHPLCVVSSVQIRPFLAWFQGNSPIYAPKRISVGLGGMPEMKFFVETVCTIGDFNGNIQYPPYGNHLLFEKLAAQRQNAPVDDKDAGSSTSKCKIKKTSADWMTLTKQYPIKQEDMLQTVLLPPQTLCVGGSLLLNLLGRTQRQEADDQFYTCLGYVKAQGRPIYHFRLVSNVSPEESSRPETDFGEPAEHFYDPSKIHASLKLKLDVIDALLDSGGLQQWSEYGRCSDDRKRYARENGQPDPLDDFSGSDLGSEDMEVDVDEFDDLDEIL